MIYPSSTCFVNFDANMKQRYVTLWFFCTVEEAQSQSITQGYSLPAEEDGRRGALLSWGVSVGSGGGGGGVGMLSGRGGGGGGAGSTSEVPFCWLVPLAAASSSTTDPWGSIKRTEDA